MRGFLIMLLAAASTACTLVGPTYQRPDTARIEDWPAQYREQFDFDAQQELAWWELFDDPVLNELVRLAQSNNNNLKIAGLRVLESRAILGIAIGNQYPQGQFAFGDASAVRSSKSNANTGGGDLVFSQYNLGVSASWELDFWGRFRRGIEAADANLLATIASYDDLFVLLTAQVADAYAVIRTTQEQLRIAEENIVIQQRSFEITDVLYRNGAGNELDSQRAQTLLLATQASVPGLETSLQQAKNALSVLLGLPPSGLSDLLGENRNLPDIPESLQVGVPADMLRQRPDVRQAEYLAMAQNARVGVATADLYPSFSLNGTLGLSSSGGTATTQSGDSGVSALFGSNSVTYALGASFVWPFLNYDRIENNIRVEDARLQQALVNYQQTVLQAAREVEDAMVAFVGAQQQDILLAQTVASALRSTELSLLRFQEGFADYQRVIDAQQAQITQQQRYISNRGLAIRSLIAVYRSLGGGWQIAADRPWVDEATQQQMQQRGRWDTTLNATHPGSGSPPPRD